MTLLLARIRELTVGGDRMEMSRAVPRRSGTRGVTSKAIRGFTPLADGLVTSLLSGVTGLTSPMSKASINPGVTTMAHSWECKLSQTPWSDHENTEAIVLEAWFAC